MLAGGTITGSLVGGGGSDSPKWLQSKKIIRARSKVRNKNNSYAFERAKLNDYMNNMYIKELGDEPPLSDTSPQKEE